MTARTAAEVGEIARQRRVALHLAQESIPGVSSSLVRRIEQGTAPREGQDLVRSAYMAALRWPSDAIDRLYEGANPADLDLDPDPEPVQMAASGADLEQLRLEDPETYAHLEALARVALDRARSRAE